MEPENLISDEVRQAFQCLKALSEFDRGLVLCWFCKYCHRYVGPGDSCTCTKDE